MTDQLDEIWAIQEAEFAIETEAADAADVGEVVERLRSLHRSERRRLLVLNIQEILPSLALFAGFGLVGLAVSDGAPFLLAAFLCLGVGLVLAFASIGQLRVEGRFDDSIRGQLERRRSLLRFRERLHHRVLWWYLLPCALALLAVVSAVGGVVDNPAGLVTVVLAAGLGWWLYRANRRVAEEHFRPRADRIDAMLADLDRGGPHLDAGS